MPDFGDVFVVVILILFMGVSVGTSLVLLWSMGVMIFVPTKRAASAIKRRRSPPEQADSTDRE